MERAGSSETYTTEPNVTSYRTPKTGSTLTVNQQKTLKLIYNYFLLQKVSCTKETPTLKLQNKIPHVLQSKFVKGDMNVNKHIFILFTYSLDKTKWTTAGLPVNKM